MKIKGYRLFKINEDDDCIEQINIKKLNGYWCAFEYDSLIFKELNNCLIWYLKQGYCFHENSVVLDNENFTIK